jgi:hypothetical protein
VLVVVVVVAAVAVAVVVVVVVVGHLTTFQYGYYLPSNCGMINE